MQPEEGEVTLWPVRAENALHPRAWHLKSACAGSLPPRRAFSRWRELPRDLWKHSFPVGVIPCVRVHLPGGLAERRISRLRPRTRARYVPTNEIQPVRALRIKASSVREWRYHRCEPLLDGTWHRPWAVLRSELREDHRALPRMELPDGGQEVRGRKPSPMARRRCVNRHLLARLPSGAHVRRWPAPHR